MSFGYVLYIQWNSASTTTTWRRSIGRVRGGWGGRVTLAFLKASCFSAITSFLQFFLWLKLFSFVLRAAIAHRYCTIKSQNGKSLCRQYKFQKSLQYEFVTSHWHFTAHAHTPTPCPASTMLQDNVMELSKLLLTGYQFSSVRITIEYVVVLRGARLAVL